MIEKTALEGIKVLDLTRVLAGPFSTMVLADLGAEVIKLEVPEIGDDARHFGPFINDQSAYFISINRNKKSITLNLKTEKGRALFLSLVKKVDVLVENFRCGTMEKLGLEYDTLKRHNPGLIYASITGFGQTGPYRNMAAYDGIVQAMGGIMSITGNKDEKGVRVGASIGDITAGLFCTCGILAALIYRKNTGEGQVIDVSMLDSQVAILENAISRYLVTGQIPKPMGNMHTSIFPFEVFPSKDAEIMIAAGNNELWEKLCAALEKPELAKDEKFATNPLRGENHDLMYELLCRETIKETTSFWFEKLKCAGIPCSPISGIDEVVKNPQVLSRKMIVEVNHPRSGAVKIPGIPVKMSKTPGVIHSSAPGLGQHNAEVMTEMLGLSESSIKAFEAEGII